jgi:hypothetical protein
VRAGPGDDATGDARLYLGDDRARWTWMIDPLDRAGRTGRHPTREDARRWNASGSPGRAAPAVGCAHDRKSEEHDAYSRSTPRVRRHDTPTIRNGFEFQNRL